MNIRLSVGLKLSLILSLAICVLLAAGSFTLSTYLKGRLEQQSIDNLGETSALVVETIDVYNRSLERTIERITAVLRSAYPGRFEYDPETQALFHDGVEIFEYDTETVDRFTASTDAVATVLARVGNDFLRATTSLMDEEGKRSVNTLLGADEPAVAALLKGETFTGKMRMFGRDMMTRYEPVLSADGEVIGAFFVGIDFTDGLVELNDSILRTKVGETGYPYVLEASGPRAGELIIHPSLKGRSMLDVEDANGRPFIVDILAQKEGALRYAWREPGSGEVRDKIAVFRYYEPWDWVIVSGSYLDEFNGAGQEVGNAMLLFSALMIPVTMLIIFFSARQWISRPLNEAVAVAERVAKADLAVQVRARSADEIGSLMRAMQQMVGGLATTISAVRETALKVDSDASLLHRQAAELRQSSDRQSDAAAGMAAAVEQMSTSIDLIAANTSEARQISAAAASTAADSSSTIQAASASMQQIANVVEDAANQLDQLHQSTAKISGIVQTIGEIAEQTNLLALNAAIEAARAGEQGRGFAVVADEVRKLAERTTGSTQEIAAMVELVQRDTASAVSVMSAGVKQVESSVRLAAEADAALSRIREGAVRTSAIVADISSAVTEQSAAASSVAQGVEEIAQMTERNSSEARESAVASEGLQQTASSLRQSVEHFRC